LSGSVVWDEMYYDTTFLHTLKVVKLLFVQPVASLIRNVSYVSNLTSQ